MREKANSRVGELEGAMQLRSSGAIFSEDRRYRYILWRKWDPKRAVFLFVGLNPSTADEHHDDPTIRRCIGFAKKERAGGLIVANLFSLNATKPGDLFASQNPIGELTDSWLVAASRVASRTIACWGVHGSRLGRNASVLQFLGEVFCLGTTAQGHPRHPLYLRKETPLRML
jgi:hypothetical protein